MHRRVGEPGSRANSGKLAGVHPLLHLYRTLAPPAARWTLRRMDRLGDPRFRSRRGERLGQVAAANGELWVHCASVGEVHAVAGLIDALSGPGGYRVVVSTHTETGAERVQARFPQTSVRHLFAPLDTPRAVTAWMNATRPAAGLIVETELWPELLLASAARSLPLALVNARISQRAWRRYRWVRPMFTQPMRSIGLALCQREVDRQRLHALGLGADRIEVTGNLKFDLEPPAQQQVRAQALRSQWGNRPVWVAGSTHSGEEAIVLQSHGRIRRTHPDALLVLVPRHPDRAPTVRRHAAAMGLPDGPPDRPDDRPAVVVIDRMGELPLCYAAADACFVGGSLVRHVGGHNLIEPILAGRPVLTGPHLADQQDAAECLRDAGALVQVGDSDQLADAVIERFDHPDQGARMAEAGLSALAPARGALARSLRALQAFLPNPTR